MTSAEMQEQIAALSARVAFIEGACRECRQKRTDERLSAQRMELGRQRRALVADPVRVLGESSADQIRELTREGLTVEELVAMARAVGGEAREKLLRAVGLNNPVVRRTIDIYLAPPPRVIRLRGRDDGTVQVRLDKGEWFGEFANDLTKILPETEWVAVQLRDSGDQLKMLISAGNLIVERLSDEDSWRWACTEGR